MKLSEKQERLVARYYDEVAARTNGITSADREKALHLLKTRVSEEMARYGSVAASDGEVVALLRLCTRAVPQLAHLLNTQQEQLDLDLGGSAYAGAERSERSSSRGRSSRTSDVRVGQGRLLESTEHRRWLGVCWHISRRLGVEVRYVRLGALVLGVMTGPFALIAYLGAYLEMYFSSERRMQPSMDPIRLVKAMANATCLALAMFATSHFVMVGIRAAYQKVFGEEVAAMGGLNWLELNGFGLFLLVIISTLPLAALSALPLADGWDETAGRLYKALLALYAVGISLGVAAFLVGVMLGFVQRYTG